MIEFIIESVKNSKTKEEIANELVAKAISHGSADNVTVVIVNLAELYQRWQRSTPFHSVSKARHSGFSGLEEIDRQMDVGFSD